MKTAREDHRLMNLLKVTEVSRMICDTNMGTLKLRLRKGESTYRFLLDSVELPKDLNKELFELLYPVTPLPINDLRIIPIPKEVDLSKVTKEVLYSKNIIVNKDGGLTVETEKPKGRPKGSKNKKNLPKEHVTK